VSAVETNSQRCERLCASPVDLVPAGSIFGDRRPGLCVRWRYASLRDRWLRWSIPKPDQPGT